MWLTGQDVAGNGSAGGSRQPDLATYRAAVADLVAQAGGRAQSWTARSAEQALLRRLPEPALASVLSATPAGLDATAERLLSEVRNYRPSARSSAATLAGLVRISLLAQIDALWWGDCPAYRTDADLRGAADLTDLDPLRRSGQLGFRYRRQAVTLLSRAARSAERRAWPDRTPRTAGLRLARTRPQAAALLNELAAEFARHVRAGTPPLWVTSLTRSVEHQRQLRALGYTALLPSSHCAGYAADIEVAWFRRFGAHWLLQRLLLERQEAGQINVIDEGQAWHICLGPAAGHRLSPVAAGRAGS